MMSGILPASAFVATDIVERKLQMLDDSVIDVSLRLLPHSDWEVFRMQSASTDEERAARATSVIMQKSLIDPATGKPAMTLEQAVALHDKIAKRLVALILEVNGYTRAGAAAVTSEKKS